MPPQKRIPINIASKPKKLSRSESFTILTCLVGALLVLLHIDVIFKALGIILLCLGFVWFVRISHWTHKWSRKKQIMLSAIAVTVLCTVSLPQFIAQWRTEHLRPESPKLKGEKPCTPKDPHDSYIPPKGPLVRFDGGPFMPSQFMCLGLSDEARFACLCPRPLAFTVEPMPAPKDDNYENLLTINEKCDPMYRVRVFLRDMFSNLNLLETYPFGVGETGAATMHEDADRYSFEINSSAPQSRFKVAIKSSRGLRVICVNQIN